MRALFVAGAGTDVGKTYAACALLRHVRGRGRPVVALKPVVSGVPAWDDPDFAQSDTARLLAAAGAPLTLAAVAACSPWRFTAPLSPDMAAAREGRAVALGELIAFHRAALAAAPPDALVLVEGVGGVMSPVTAEATGLDWLQRLDCPAVLVAGGYLGAISHALTACEALAARGVPLAGVVVSESLEAPAPAAETAAAIARFTPAPVAVLARDGAWPQELSLGGGGSLHLSGGEGGIRTHGAR